MLNKKIAIVLFVSCAYASAEVFLDVTILDTQSLSNPTTDDLIGAIESNLQAAFGMWMEHIVAPEEDRFIEAVVRFDTPVGGRGGGRSLSSGFVGFNGERNIWEASLPYELHSEDPNGNEFDIEISFEPAYLEDLIWFDPSPYDRIVPIDNNRIDSMSFFLHELGHAWGFNGWQNDEGGFEPFDGTFESTFDELADFDGTNWMFNGAKAVEWYRGPIPLTSQDSNTHHHLGNSEPLPGSELIVHLMNGVVFLRGQRYSISALELAILQDIGINTKDFAGDFDLDHVLDEADINALSSKARLGATDYDFDLDHNGVVDEVDRQIWVNQRKQTFFGDSNLDGEFNTGDLVAVFETGEYEDNIVGNSKWETGDWNGDADFGSGDLVVAFQQGGFEQGPRKVLNTVPEPTSEIMVAVILVFWNVRLRIRY